MVEFLLRKIKEILKGTSETPIKVWVVIVVLILCIVNVLLVNLNTHEQTYHNDSFISQTFSNNISNLTDFDLTFMHIPKNGGSTIEDILKYKFNIIGGKYQFTDKNGKLYKKKICNCPSWHCPLNSFFESNVSLPLNMFAVVRNPFHRYVSQYQWCYDSADFPCWRNFRKHFHYIVGDACDVENFNHITSIVFRGLLNGSIKWELTACHYVPQYQYIYYKNEKLVRHVLMFESFTNDFMTLLKSYNDTRNIKEKDFHNSFHKRSYLRNIPPKKCLNLSVNDIDDINQELIRQYYVKDFEYFYQTNQRIANHF